ncbi:hypothetical protein J6590_036998 [Homalodisca vitripennis]|nr:hypothetical protein J6590_036998 [Homalodisca vitripennis]
MTKLTSVKPKMNDYHSYVFTTRKHFRDNTPSSDYSIKLNPVNGFVIVVKTARHNTEPNYLIG